MKMENKYYTPDITEFHIGFEYEIRNDVQEIKKCVYNPTDYELLEHEIKDGNVRIKELDKEDIKSEGFISDSIDVEMNHVYRKGNIFISVYPYLYSRLEISNGKCYPDRLTYFDGIIKNKSELKRILNQISKH